MAVVSTNATKVFVYATHNLVVSVGGFQVERSTWIGATTERLVNALRDQDETVVPGGVELVVAEDLLDGFRGNLVFKRPVFKVYLVLQPARRPGTTGAM